MLRIRYDTKKTNYLRISGSVTIFGQPNRTQMAFGNRILGYVAMSYEDLVAEY